MPQSFLLGRSPRLKTATAVLCLSIGSINTLLAADGSNPAAGTVQLNHRAANREIEAEEHAQYPGLTIAKPGLSTRAIRKQAIAELPLNRLSPDAQQKTQIVLKNLGMYRRLPSISFECDPDVYDYFIKNPDVAVSTWRAMEISQFQLQETSANHYHADAGDGSVGEVELFLRTPNETLIYCDGAFKSPMLPKPIVARSLMRVQTSFTREQDGRITCTHMGDVFVEFPSPAIETVVKVIAPVSHTIADRNFKQMTLFVHLMSQAMARHPGWIEQIGQKLEGIPAQKKMEFQDVVVRSAANSRIRQVNAKGGQGISPEEVLSPFRQWNVQPAAAPGSVQLTTGAAAGNTNAVQTASQAGTVTLQK